MSVSDETMAAWVREQNRGAPAWEDLDNSARAWWRDRYTIRHAGVKQDQPNIVRQVVNAWDCCGTCAGGVMARHTRERVDTALEAAAQAIEAELICEEDCETCQDVRDAARIVRAQKRGAA